MKSTQSPASATPSATKVVPAERTAQDNLGPVRYFTQPTDRILGGIFFRGLLRNNPGLSPRNLRTLDCHALVYVFAGSGFYEDAQGLQAEVMPGTLILLFPGLAHAYGKHRGGNWSEIFFMLKSPLWSELERLGGMSRSDPLWRLHPTEYWARRFHAFLDEAPAPGETSGMEELGKLVQLLGEAREAGRRQPEIRGRQWLARARSFLEDPDLELDEVARELGTSYESFRKTFKTQLQMSPKQYRDRHRIEEACRLLHSSALPIKMVSDRLRYCDPFHFSKQFKSYTGMSPREFRRAARA